MDTMPKKGLRVIYSETGPCAATWGGREGTVKGKRDGYAVVDFGEPVRAECDPQFLRPMLVHLCSLSRSSLSVCGKRVREGNDATVTLQDVTCTDCMDAQPVLFAPAAPPAAPAQGDTPAAPAEDPEALPVYDFVDSIHFLADVAARRAIRPHPTDYNKAGRLLRLALELRGGPDVGEVLLRAAEFVIARGDVRDAALLADLRGTYMDFSPTGDIPAGRASPPDGWGFSYIVEMEDAAGRTICNAHSLQDVEERFFDDNNGYTLDEDREDTLCWEDAARFLTSPTSGRTVTYYDVDGVRHTVTAVRS